MSKLIDKILGRVEPVEPQRDICAWKAIAEKEFQLEGNLEHCNLCDGYKTGCHDYTIKTPEVSYE